MRRIPRPILISSAIVALAHAAAAQTTPAVPLPSAPSCSTPDSLEFVGSTHRTPTVLREDAGLPAGQPLNSAAIQRAVKNLFATGQFEDNLDTKCRIEKGKAIFT